VKKDISEMKSWVCECGVNVFKVIYQQFIAIYSSGCPICCYWSRLKLGFKVPSQRITMPQIKMIPHPVTLN